MVTEAFGGVVGGGDLFGRGGPLFRKTGRPPLPMANAAAYRSGMSLSSDQPPPSPTKPKLSVEEHRARQADRLGCIRLRMAIGQELNERGITAPVAVGEALGMPAPEAVKLVNRRQWRKGDVDRLKAAAARLGLQVPGVE